MILSLEDDCLHRTACGAGGGTRSLQERVNPLSPDRRGYIFQSLFAPPFSLLVEEAPQQALQSSQEYLSSTLSQTGIHGRAWEAMMMDAEKPLREAQGGCQQGNTPHTTPLLLKALARESGTLCAKDPSE